MSSGALFARVLHTLHCVCSVKMKAIKCENESSLVYEICLNTQDSALTYSHNLNITSVSLLWGSEEFSFLKFNHLTKMLTKVLVPL